MQQEQSYNTRTMALHGSPVHHALNRHQDYRSECLSIKQIRPEPFEALYDRLFLRDPVAGCLDPDVILSSTRDETEVELVLPDSIFRLKYGCEPLVHV